jgi:hypothetical protein
MIFARCGPLLLHTSASLRKCKSQRQQGNLRQQEAHSDALRYLGAHSEISEEFSGAAGHLRRLFNLSTAMNHLPFSFECAARMALAHFLLACVYVTHEPFNHSMWRTQC